MKLEYKYFNGVAIHEGDIVLLTGLRGLVEMIMQPGTDAARDYNCAATGGFLLKFENGDLQLWKEADEDLQFVSRQSNQGPN
jgi:hypothetical protein